MTRILIVEDNPSTRDQLAKYLRESMIESYIDVDGNIAQRAVTVEEAETVTEAKQKIDKANAGGVPYDAAVLDYKLPFDKGLTPQGDFSVCQYLTTVSRRSTFIMHVSAFEDDSTLMQHISNKHSRVGQATADFIDKSAGWTQRVVQLLRSQIYGRQILTQKESIFQARDRPRRMLGRGQKSLTHSVAALLRDVMTYWKYLDPEVQEEIKDVMIVQKNDDGTVFASLI